MKTCDIDRWRSVLQNKKASFEVILCIRTTDILFYTLEYYLLLLVFSRDCAVERSQQEEKRDTNLLALTRCTPTAPHLTPAGGRRPAARAGVREC